VVASTLFCYTHTHTHTHTHSTHTHTHTQHTHTHTHSHTHTHTHTHTYTHKPTHLEQWLWSLQGSQQNWSAFPSNWFPTAGHTGCIVASLCICIEYLGKCEVGYSANL